MKIVVFLKTNVPAWDPPHPLLQKLQMDFEGVRFAFPENANDLLNEVADADAFFSWLITPEILDRTGGLKWFHTAGIQYGHMFPPNVFDRVLVTNSKGVHAIPVSENLMGMILTLARHLKLPQLGEVPEEGGVPIGIKSLYGATLGVVGLGGNGSMLARRAKGFGANIVAIKRTVTEKMGIVDQLWPPPYLGELLKVSDIVALTAPLTKETEGLFNEETFSLIKEGAVFVSSSRPQLVKESALIEAIEDGIVAGVGVDDQWPKESPLLQMPRVIIAPHIAPNEPNCWERIIDLFSENLKLFIESKPLMNVMDRELLY